ncbi:MAG: glycosyltransferase family 2 protein, partial [Solobacterium sp.]|nr:glycosyltransferase family 2 protein [Solobacterium sp.]
MVKVSVILPVYNAEEHLQHCIDSILAQEFEDLELIAVDDGSKDGSPAMLDDYTAKDSRIKVIHKENGGVSSTRNRGLEEAQGEYIQFIDSDDWLPADSIKLLVRAMEDN